MKQFWWKTVVFAGINLLILSGVLLRAWQKDDDLFFHFSLTESVLNSLPENQEYDLLIMGSSHGRIFSRGPNHRVVEQILGLRMANISRSAAGIIPESAYLDYFYSKGNSAETIVYFLDPFVFSTVRWNERQFFLTEEPFEPGFLRRMIRYGIEPGVMYAYIRSKFEHEWKKNHGIVRIDESFALEYRVEESVRKRLEALYPDGYTKAVMDSYIPELKALLELARQHKTRVVFILPPTLLGKTPGHSDLVNHLRQINQQYQIPYYDYSDEIRDPRLYYNHDHLNRRGVRLFTLQYLKPLLIPTP